jgi:hypothetical protein
VFALALLVSFPRSSDWSNPSRGGDLKRGNTGVIQSEWKETKNEVLVSNRDKTDLQTTNPKEPGQNCNEG